MADYLKDRERVRRTELSRTRSVVNAHILPFLGTVELSKLTHSRLKGWRDGVAEASPRVRSKATASDQAFRQIDSSDADALRKRQATANRILTVLKAGLNHAYRENKVASKAAWEKITAFREVDVPKVRYLSVAECKRLIHACPSDFRALIRGALYTGCRYGELTALRVDGFNRDSHTIHVERSKSGKGRFIPLTTEGAAFFNSVTADRADNERMFTHAEGVRKAEPWEHSQQRYWMELACKNAEIAPAIGFHILRHTYASQLAMNGTPMPVIAALLGHADTRMTERHYGHLSPSYVADTLRANLPSFGFEANNKPQLVTRTA
jgi:integrase